MANQPMNEMVVGRITELMKNGETLPLLYREIPLDTTYRNRIVFFSTDDWEFDMFGDKKTYVVRVTKPKFWVRFWTRVFFRSKWTRFVNMNQERLHKWGDEEKAYYVRREL